MCLDYFSSALIFIIKQIPLFLVRNFNIIIDLQNLLIRLERKKFICTNKTKTVSFAAK